MSINPLIVFFLPAVLGMVLLALAGALVIEALGAMVKSYLRRNKNDGL